MDTFGTVCDLAGNIGVKYETSKKWRQRGVPPKYFFDLLTEAQRLGVKLTEADLKAVSSAELSTTSRKSA